MDWQNPANWARDKQNPGDGLAVCEITPPAAVIRIQNPKLAVEPTIVVPPQVQLASNNMPNLGDPNFRSAVAACHSQVVFAVSRQSRIDFAGQDSCSRTSGRKSQGEGSAPGSQLDDLPAIGFWNRINHIGDEETLRRHEAAGLTMFQQAGPEEVQMRFQAVRHDDSLVIISRVPSARPLHLWELSRERSGHGGDHIRLADGIMPEMETVDAGFLAGRRKRRGNCARKTSRAGRSSCLWQNHGDGLAQGFQSERLAENDIHARRRTV